MTPDLLDSLLTLPRLLDPQVSPDGRWVAWVWMGIGATADVYAAPTDGSQPPLKLSESAENTFLANWTPDSRAVLVVQDHEGDERDRLFRIDLDAPGVMTLLTDAEPNYFLRGGSLHPNGRWLVYGANLDESGAEIEPTWIYRRDLDTGERVVLARPEQAAYIRPSLSPNGQHVLYTRKDKHPAGVQLWLVDIDGANDREIVNAGDDRQVYGTWFPDGEHVLVLADADTHMRVGVWQPDAPLRWLVDDQARNIEEIHFPHNSRQCIIVEMDHTRVRASLLDPDTGAETRLPDVPGNLQPLAPTPDGAWIGEYYSSRQPNDLVRFQPGDSPDQFASLTRIWERTPFQPGDFVAAEDYRWHSVDGLEIQGWLYRARGEARGTVVYVHGGPTWYYGDQLLPTPQFFALHGFNVLLPNYRGSTGFSRDYREAIKDDGWGGREQDDIRTGVEALIRDGIAQPGRVGITGTSYGGYSSWHAITHFPAATIAASAPVCGMTDLVIDYETTRPDLRPYSAEMMGGTPEQQPERYYERSPINFVQNIEGRLLIVQGLRDPNVSPENVRVVRARLDEHGIEYGMLVFEDEGHGVYRIPNQKKLLLQLADFFAGAFSGS